MQTISKENAAPKSKKTAAETPAGTTSLPQQQQYNDIYFRANFSDNGVYPRDGVLCGSPDIIPYGENPVSDPYNQFIQNNWQQDVGKNINARQANYIYMRGKNLSTQPRTGKLYLYWSKASLLLWPQDPKHPDEGWKHQNIPTSSGEQFSVVQPAGGAYVVTEDPFYWVPENIDPNQDHYCLIGRVETFEHPNPIPDQLKDVNAFAEYISMHPNLCWRNVYTINANHETNTATVRYDQGEKAEEIYIFIQCTGAPVGSDVSFSCGTPGPVPPIKLNRTRVSTEDSFTAGGSFKIPANFSSNISYTYYSNGLSPSGPMSIELKAVLIVDGNHKLYDYATPLENMGASAEQLEQLHQERGLDTGTFSLRGIKLGSYTMQSLNLPSAKSDLTKKTSKNVNEPTDSYMKAISYGWLEEHRSIFGNSYTENRIRTEKDILKPYHPEKLFFSSAEGDSSEASLYSLVEFNNGDNAGQYNIHLNTTNIPMGCEIAFTGGSQEYPIVLNKTTVTTFPVFSAGIAIDLPAELNTTISFSLWRNGYQLPLDAQASIELKAVLLKDPDNLPGKPPIHGKIIGSVTAYIQ